MSEFFKAVKITDNVYWVGAIDWAIRDFHGYSTSRGTTYNAFLILADKVTLIDTVKAPFMGEMLSRIASVVDPGKIDFIISNHSEMDHSGCLFDMVEAVKPEKVFASLMGVKALTAHFHRDDEVDALKDGDSLSLGNMNLSFLETRMLHWPDSMFTYLAEERLLFSQDGFGMHLATTERFADEIDDAVLLREGAKYFANILLPFSPFVEKLLDRVGKLDIAIDIVAPDHGPVWRTDVGRILALYGEWASQKPTTKAVVAYDTMWQSTALMARTICEGLVEGGATAKLLPLASSHRSDVATEILDAGALLVGSPTMNNHLLPPVADMLTYLKGLRPGNLVGAAFGSHGWSGEGAKQVEEMLSAMKVEMIGTIQTQYVPGDEVLTKCFSLGELVAKRLLEICGGE